MDYNTQREKLIMPEYGRHIQKMVEQIKKIEDKEKRSEQIRAVVQVMSTLNPHLKDYPDFKHKLWDHVFAIAEYDLDIDAPFPIPTKEEIQSKPNKIEVNKSSIVLHYLHADGTEGFPGNLHIYMTYTLKDGTWRIDYSAKTDKTRPVNISNHPYFNLSGEGNGSCHDYIMYVNADKFVGTSGLDVLEELIPLDGKVMDYRTPHRVGDALESDDPFIKRSNTGFDHNYCINGEGFRKAASLYNPLNGIYLEVYSDQPGLQLYSGQWINGKEIGKCGKPLERYSSFTFETQNYPDAPNKPSFPDPFLKPGEEYTHTCEYRFSINNL